MFYVIPSSEQTLNRRRPTFGGYSTKQEMCLSFITYYPKIDLAGCYSMTPVKEFFEIFGVYEFNSMNMTDVENLFLYTGFVYFILKHNSLTIKKNISSHLLFLLWSIYICTLLRFDSIPPLSSMCVCAGIEMRLIYCQQPFSPTFHPAAISTMKTIREPLKRLRTQKNTPLWVKRTLFNKNQF